MENEKRRHNKWILIGVFTLFIATLVASYFISGLSLNKTDARKAVVNGATVSISEIQKDGKFVIVDYPDIDLSSYVTLGDYKNMTVAKVEKPEITDEIIDSNIASYIEYYGKYDKRTDGTVAKGDLIAINYTGYYDGKALSELTATEQRIVLGESGEPEGFVLALDGVEVGKQVEFDVVFPEDYTLDGQAVSYAGKTITFKATVTEVDTIPEVTDENVSEITNGKYDTVEAFREFIRQEVDEYDTTNYESVLSDEIITQMMADAKFKSVPHEYLVWYVALNMRFYQDYADQYNMTVDEYLKEIGLTGTEAVVSELTQYAVEEIPRYALLTAVAKAEGIVVDEEADAELLNDRSTQLIEGLGLSGQEKLLDYYKKSNLYNDVLNWKVLSWLMENVQQVEITE